MKKKIYLGLGIVGGANAIFGNPIGALLRVLLGEIGWVLGDILSGTSLIFLLLALYFHHKDKK